MWRTKYQKNPDADSSILTRPNADILSQGAIQISYAFCGFAWNIYKVITVFQNSLLSLCFHRLFIFIQRPSIASEDITAPGSLHNPQGKRYRSF